MADARRRYYFMPAFAIVIFHGQALSVRIRTDIAGVMPVRVILVTSGVFPGDSVDQRIRDAIEKGIMRVVLNMVLRMMPLSEQ